MKVPCLSPQDSCPGQIPEQAAAPLLHLAMTGWDHGLSLYLPQEALRPQE